VQGLTARGGGGRLEVGEKYVAAPRWVDVGGDPTAPARVVSISCGACHSAAVTADDRLFCWGKNDCGQCGPYRPPLETDLREEHSANRYRPGPLPPDVILPHHVRLPQSSRAGARKDAGANTRGARDTLGGTGRMGGTPGLPFAARAPWSPMSRRSGGASERGSVPGTPRSGATAPRVAGVDDPRQEEGAAGGQVACGECHTLLLLGGQLWVLGGGLDRRYRLDNMSVKRLPKKDALGQRGQVLLDPMFYPRPIEFAFTDTAEISVEAPPPPDERQDHDGPEFGAPVRYFKSVIEVVNEDDPEAPPVRPPCAPLAPTGRRRGAGRRARCH
jgi:hypothetical protein